MERRMGNKERTVKKIIWRIIAWMADKIIMENGGKRRNQMDNEKHIRGYRHRGDYWKRDS